MKMKSPALLDGVSQLCLTPVHWFGQFERVALHVDGGQPRAVTTEAGTVTARVGLTHHTTLDSFQHSFYISR